MFDLGNWFDDKLASVVPPSLLGAAIGWSYSKNQTIRQRTVSFVISAGIAAYATAAVSENLQWGPASLAVFAILFAAVGTDIVGGFVEMGRQWKADPTKFFARWWSTWRNGAPPPEQQPPAPPAGTPDLPPRGDPMRRDS